VSIIHQNNFSKTSASVSTTIEILFPVTTPRRKKFGHNFGAKSKVAHKHTPLIDTSSTMVLADAICAMNLAVSTIVNGVCCCYQINEDTKHRQKQEEVLTNVVRREFYRNHEHEQQKMLLQPYDEPMIETSCDNNRYHNENHYDDAFACGNDNHHHNHYSLRHNSNRYNDAFACGNDNRHIISSSNRYNDAFACASRWRDEHRHKEMAQTVHKYCYTNNANTDTNNNNNTPRENPPSCRDGRFYHSLIAPSQSFSSVITKKSDNRFRLQDQMPELFSVTSSLSRFSSLDSLKELPHHSNHNHNYCHESTTSQQQQQQQPTTTNQLSPIKPGFSLLDNIVDDEDDENSIRREELIDIMVDCRDDIIDLQEIFIE
jgi:hypothetical protein